VGSNTVTIVGAPGSPYSRKMLALLRYRRIPYRWITRGSKEDSGLPAAKVDLLPLLLFDKGNGELEAAIDSTPLIRRLEEEHADSPLADRSVLPPDPALALVDALVEDFADEWMTKAMFHYRWSFEADVSKASAVLPRWGRPEAEEGLMLKMGDVFGQRQIERRSLVGINAANSALIEDSYKRTLAALDHALSRAPYLAGGRPGAGDFAVYGQLTQLVGFDPTPSGISLEIAPRVCAWIDVMDDKSGVEPQPGDWADRQATADNLAPLLAEFGRCYAPFLLANAAAVAGGMEKAEVTIGTSTWSQPPFVYQARCLAVLRQRYSELGPDDSAWVDQLLAGCGVAALFLEDR